MLDAGFIILRSCPDLLGAARRPRAADTCAAKGSLPGTKLPFIAHRVGFIHQHQFQFIAEQLAVSSLSTNIIVVCPYPLHSSWKTLVDIEAASSLIDLRNRNNRIAVN